LLLINHRSTLRHEIKSFKSFKTGRELPTPRRDHERRKSENTLTFEAFPGSMAGLDVNVSGRKMKPARASAEVRQEAFGL
jgi:hypothetical protein